MQLAALTIMVNYALCDAFNSLLKIKHFCYITIKNGLYEYMVSALAKLGCCPMFCGHKLTTLPTIQFRSGRCFCVGF